MHEAKPHGLFVHGSDLTMNDLNFIEHYSKIVTNIWATSKLESIKYTRELPDGGFVIIQNVGDIFRTIAFKPEISIPEVVNDGVAKYDIPMLFSGVIDRGIAYDGHGIDIKLTNECALRLGNYLNAVAKNVNLQRFRCEYNVLNKAMFVPQLLQFIDPNKVLYTQYDKLKATWYSGALAEAVQIVGGFGRQDFENLPEDIVEQSKFSIPYPVMEKIKLELPEETRLPAYNGIPDREGQIRYNFTFNKTHLISFDELHKPWLVQVGSDGVWVMPLPVIPATTTMAFHEYVQEVGDSELSKIIERFGAIPSGEVFPEGADFHRWVRAGVIIKVCDVLDFYQHSPYSSVCGWSCNSSGTNLINTCFDYENDLCYGYTYQIRLKLSAADNQGLQFARNLSHLTPSQAQRIARYLSELFEALPDDTDPLTVSIKYKMRRVSIEDISLRLGNEGSHDVEYWDNFICNPIAVHQGNSSCSNKGNLYGGPRFKLPEPFLEGCINQSFEPRKPKTVYPKSDTIMFAYYINDDLKVIKNFYDDRKFIKEVEGNFDDLMIVGSWEQTEYIGWTGFAGNTYSTDFDHRQEIAPTEKYTKIEGTDKGYGKPLAVYYAFFWTDGELRRTRHYTHKVNINTKSAKHIEEAFIVPFFNRNAAIYVENETGESEIKEESVKMYGIQDPNQYRFWTFDESWHSFNNSVKRTGKPFPVDSSPVWAEIHYYRHDGERSDFADEGDWIGGLPADVTRLVNPPNGVTLNSYGGDAPTVEEYSESHTETSKTKYAMHLSLLNTPRKIHERAHNSHYYTNSPDAWGNVVFEDACKVVFGNASYANISVKDEQDRRYNFGHSTLVNHTVNHTFIGVINE